MARFRYFGKATLVLRHFNWAIAVLVTLCAVYLHALFLLSAGGLWRDEANLVHLSLLPSVSEVWQNLPHESFPILMPLAVRAWSAAGFGNTDIGLRVLGLLVGMFLLLAFWFASWTMRNGPPLLAVTLAGLNVTLVRAGDSLRAYGLGSAGNSGLSQPDRRRLGRPQLCQPGARRQAAHGTEAVRRCCGWRHQEGQAVLLCRL